MMYTDRIKYLFHRYDNQLATEAEAEELFRLLEDPANQEPINALFIEEIRAGQEAELEWKEWDPIIQTILTSFPREEDTGPARGTVRTLGWVTAAAAVLILALSTWFLVNRGSEPAPSGALTAEQRFKNDVQPGTNSAVLTLADGTQVILDSAQSGALATEGMVKVKRLANGEIVYNASGPMSGVSRFTYNTITNPKGSKVVSLTLADGSKVWLDAASSITYPTAFVGKERTVKVRGQAYFEVAKKPGVGNGEPVQKVPFIVEVDGGTNVRVLGTHFNVMAFEEEDATRVTLLEGSVEVRSPDLPAGRSGQKATIKPGEQAVVALSPGKGAPLTIDYSPDLRAVMAWKDGVFRFEGTTIEPIMKQLARWYDVEVVYEDRPTDIFVSTIPRDVPASQVFKILETTGRVHFKIEGKKVTVMK